jgi:hypothetical protein
MPAWAPSRPGADVHEGWGPPTAAQREGTVAAGG